MVHICTIRDIVSNQQADLLGFILDTTIDKWGDDLEGQQMLLADNPELCGGANFMEASATLSDLLQELKDLKYVLLG